MKRFSRLLVLIPLLALSASAKDLKRPKSIIELSDQKIQYDRQLTSLAEVLAGRDPEGADYKELTALDAWKSHKKYFNENWSKLDRTRLKPMTVWRDKELKIDGPEKSTVVYPFSGPDFLNVYLFFPHAEKYYFYSLEDAGKLPNLDSITPDEFSKVLEDIRKSLSSLFLRDYFITERMMEDLKTPYLKGNMSLFFIFNALLGNRIVDVEPAVISKEGEVVIVDTETEDEGLIPGVKITFFNEEHAKPQELYYFSGDVSDKALVNKPEFAKFLASLNPCVAFMKSASYLLHSPHFLTVRKEILNTSSFLMQDDSGMPYKYLKKNWNVRLYGQYTKPIKDFNYGFQKDLDAAYKAMSPQKLTFRFGYHWWDDFSNILVAEKEKAGEK